MEQLGRLWEKHHFKKDLKVRYVDWNFRHKFFRIKNYSSCGQKIVGELDTGEKISYPIDSKYWMAYEKHQENAAKPV